MPQHTEFCSPKVLKKTPNSAHRAELDQYQSIIAVLKRTVTFWKRHQFKATEIYKFRIKNYKCKRHVPDCVCVCVFR